LLPPQTSNPEGSLPRGEGGPPLAAVDEGLPSNPEGIQQNVGVALCGRRFYVTVGNGSDHSVWLPLMRAKNTLSSWLRHATSPQGEVFNV